MSRPDDGLVDRLSDFAAEWTGFSRDAILPDAVRRAAAQLEAAGGGDLLERAARGDRAVVHALCQAVSVGETFFFRHPEHFRFLASTILPELLASGRTGIRAWSAGCATGEETYSIAACLLHLLPASVQVEVVGTDLLERNLATARTGIYGAWSQRPSGPLLHPLFHALDKGRVAIDERVRQVTRFRLHNLLAPRADAPFDLIFCRNVLVYFSPAAGRQAASHLAAALAPGGALFFGSMDVGEAPPGLTAGLSELQIYRRPFLQASEASPARQQTLPAPEQSLPPPRPRFRLPEPAALHLRALAHIERGEQRLAERELTDLIAQRPDYLPALLERALLQGRMGQRTAAAALMREVLKRSDTLPADELLHGPEPLPVSFYRDSAHTFLRAARGGLE